MQFVVALVGLAVLVGFALGRRRDAGSFASPDSGQRPFSKVQVTDRGAGSVALTPGDGWIAAVYRYKPGTSTTVPSEDDCTLEEEEREVERLRVVAWELYHDIFPGRWDPSTSVYETRLWAHCMSATQNEIVVVKPESDYSSLLQFLRPGEDISDAELLRLHDERENERRRLIAEAESGAPLVR